MAVAHDASASAKGAGVSSLSTSLTVANNSNRCLVAFASAADSGSIGAFTSCTWNASQSMTQFFTEAPGVMRLTGYYLVNPAATTANVTVNYGSSYDECFVSGSSFYGVDQADPIGTARSTVASSGNAGGIGVDDTQSGGVVVGAAAYDLGSSGTAAIADTSGVPLFVASGSLSAAASQTSRTPALPSGLLIGDLVIAHCASENNATHSCSTTGWNKLGQTNSGASWTVSHWWALNSSSLSAPTITWSGSVDASARTHAFRDVKASAPCAYLGPVSAGTGSTHTSDGAATTVDNVRVIYLDHANANTALATPAGWLEATDSGNATGPCRTTLGHMVVAFAGTGAESIAVTGASAAWVQCQIEIYPAANNQTNLTEQENIGSPVFDAASVSYEVADTFNTLWWTFSSGSKDWAAGGIALNPASAAEGVNPPSVSDGDSFFGPRIAARRFPAHVTGSGSAYQPALRLRVSPVALSGGSAAHSPTAARRVAVPASAGAGTIHGASVLSGADIAPASLANESLFGLPRLSLALRVAAAGVSGNLFVPSVDFGTKAAPLVASTGTIAPPRVHSSPLGEAVGTLDVGVWATAQVGSRKLGRTPWPNLPKVEAPSWRLTVVTPEIARERARALMARRKRSEKARRSREANNRSDALIDAKLASVVVHLVAAEQ
jgi:hypothetical protein